jgi:hypothetical protein
VWESCSVAIFGHTGTGRLDLAQTQLNALM